jgi:hypothetical protein
MVRLYSPRRLSVVGKLDSKRGVITALRPSTDRNVDLGIVQANGRPGGSTADGRCADPRSGQRRSENSPRMGRFARPDGECGAHRSNLV